MATLVEHPFLCNRRADEYVRARIPETPVEASANPGSGYGPSSSMLEPSESWFGRLAPRCPFRTSCEPISHRAAAGPAIAPRRRSQRRSPVPPFDEDKPSGSRYCSRPPEQPGSTWRSCLPGRPGRMNLNPSPLERKADAVLDCFGRAARPGSPRKSRNEFPARVPQIRTHSRTQPASRTQSPERHEVNAHESVAARPRAAIRFGAQTVLRVAQQPGERETS